MKKRTIGLLCTSALLSVMVPVGLLAHADDFDAAKTANSIFQEAQKQSVQQNQIPANNNPAPAPSTGGNQGYSPVPAYHSNGGGQSSSNHYSAGNSSNSRSIDTSDAGTPSNGYGGSNDFQYDTDNSAPSKNKMDTSDASLGSSSSSKSRGNSSGSNHHARGLSDRQKAEIKANNYLAKVRQELALKTAQNNDGGAWELRHSYENQLQVINNGSRTAQTRALQVQLSGELDQLQAVHDRHVDTFNNEIDQLPNDHSTDKRAVDLQDSIDYEDSQLAIKQDKARKKFAKEIKEINPVHKKKAQKRAKKEYKRELKEKGLKDPYALEKSNREAWKKAQSHAEVLRNDY